MKNTIRKAGMAARIDHGAVTLMIIATAAKESQNIRGQLLVQTFYVFRKHRHNCIFFSTLKILDRRLEQRGYNSVVDSPRRPDPTREEEKSSKNKK